MMVAYSSFDANRTKLAIGSLRGTFGVSGGGHGVLPGEDRSMMIEDPRNREEEAKKSAIKQKLKAVIRSGEERRGIQVRYDSKGLRIDTAERVLFDVGSAKIKRESVSFYMVVSPFHISNADNY